MAVVAISVSRLSLRESSATFAEPGHAQRVGGHVVVAVAGERFSPWYGILDEAAGRVLDGIRRRGRDSICGSRAREGNIASPNGGPQSKLMPILQAAAFYFAEVLPYGLVCLWLWKAGVFDKFWFWTVTYAREYVQQFPLASAWRSFWQGEGGTVVSRDWIGWTLAMAGCAVVAIRGWFRPGRSLFVLGFFLCSFLCVCPGFFFRAHYFIVALPAVAMLAGVACGEFLRLASLWKLSINTGPAAPQESASTAKEKRRRRRSLCDRNCDSRRFHIPAALVLLAIAWPIGSQSDFYFTWPPLLACRVIYNGNPFLECPQIAEHLNGETTPDDTIAVLGSEPEIFFDSQRRSATGYIYTYGLVEEQPLAPQMQQEMIDEIEANKPKFIVFANARYLVAAASESANEDFRLGNAVLAAELRHCRRIRAEEPVGDRELLGRSTPQLSRECRREGLEVVCGPPISHHLSQKGGVVAAARCFQNAARRHIYNGGSCIMSRLLEYGDPPATTTARNR